MLKNKSLPFIGFLQATGVSIYVVLLSCFFNFVIPRFENGPEEFYAPVIMPLIFIISAVTTASLVLGRFGMYFWNKQYKEAFTLLLWTVVWLVVYLIIFLVLMSYQV